MFSASSTVELSKYCFCCWTADVGVEQRHYRIPYCPGHNLKFAIVYHCLNVHYFLHLVIFQPTYRIILEFTKVRETRPCYFSSSKIMNNLLKL